jgi:prepilin-type N-terminal cleavage/methylation domain-containing protein
MDANPNNRTNGGGRDGFSLIEITIALAILAFGVLAVAGAQLSALTMSRESRLRTEATYLAQQKMEAFQAMPTAGLQAALADANYPNDPANPIDPDPADGLVRQFSRSWTITPNAPENGVFTIAVQVGWNDRLGRPQNVVVQSVRSGL